jgi:uncharacterized protein (DUF1330 family)
MPAYVLVNVHVIDKERYAEYVKLAPPCIARYGGRYLARGGRAERLEGDWTPRRVVVLEFDSYERAKEWWASDEYAGPKALRQETATTEMILVDGLAAPLG